mmetsp:Transcript_18620/g.53134  ORF Transcript_18620/g.53134 Transcript_18620/m.53134 type:complete len:85 (-) Transcript_18620:68-322(-)
MKSGTKKPSLKFVGRMEHINDRLLMAHHGLCETTFIETVRKEHNRTDQQILLFQGTRLDLDDTVHDSYIRENDTLFLTLRNRGG